MNFTRHGKIARLPRQIQEQLNLRLQHGEEGPQLLDWLNALPEVQKIVADQFGGKAISKQNLSQWRQGGFREWQLREDVFEHASDVSHNASEIKAAAGKTLAGDLAVILAVKYAAWLNKWNNLDGAAGSEAEKELRLLRHLGRDIVGMQQHTHQAARLEFEKEQSEFRQAKSDSLAARAAALMKLFSPPPHSQS